jgi:hypothetical protein
MILVQFVFFCIVAVAVAVAAGARPTISCCVDLSILGVKGQKEKGTW